MDEVIRGLSANAEFRAVVVEAKDTVQGVVDAQLSAVEASTGRDRLAEILGELLIAGVLIRSEMSPERRVQVMLSGEAGSLVMDSFPDGLVRGVVSGRCPDFGEALFQVSREMYNGELHQGMVESGADMTATLSEYMLRSEQVVSTVGLSVRVSDGQVLSARGFMVQVLPDASRESLEAVIQVLEQLDPDWGEQHGELLLLDLLGGLGKFTDRFEVFSGCLCSEDTVLGALASLGAEDLAELSASEQPLEVECDYCRKVYSVAPEKLGYR